MLRDAAAQQLTRRFQSMLAKHAANSATATGRVWVGLDAWNEADVATYAGRVQQVHAAAKQTSVNLTSAYLSALTESPVVAVAADRVPTLGPDPREPFTALWRTLEVDAAAFEDALAEWVTDVPSDPTLARPVRPSNEEFFARALEAGRTAAEGRIRTHVFRASRQTGDAWAARSGQEVVGWRRVLTGSSCAWCALVSTQRYLTAESADFGHTHCDCATIPIIGEADPGRFINDRVARALDATDPRLSERIDRNRASQAQLDRADAATARRDAALAELASETDPERRLRLEQRARKWDDRAASYRAKAATAATERISVPAGVTGYVDDAGRPVARPL